MQCRYLCCHLWIAPGLWHKHWAAAPVLGVCCLCTVMAAVLLNTMAGQLREGFSSMAGKVCCNAERQCQAVLCSSGIFS